MFRKFKENNISRKADESEPEIKKPRQEVETEDVRQEVSGQGDESEPEIKKPRQEVETENVRQEVSGREKVRSKSKRKCLVRDVWFQINRFQW